MHKEVLTENQVKILPLIQNFSSKFGLVGGTAIALHLGHRQSIDFDLFSNEPFDSFAIRRKIQEKSSIERVIRDEQTEYSILANGVQLTFLEYPFSIDFSQDFEDIIKVPYLLTLAAMKAYALGRRNKWKDYVDLYFIMQNHHRMDDIVQRSKEMFGEEFNEKIFKTQLAYFEDIDYSEKVIFMPGFEVGDEEIQKALVEFSLQ